MVKFIVAIDEPLVRYLVGAFFFPDRMILSQSDRVVLQLGNVQLIGRGITRQAKSIELFEFLPRFKLGKLSEKESNRRDLRNRLTDSQILKTIERSILKEVKFPGTRQFTQI